MSDSNAKSIKDKVQTVIFLSFLIIFPMFALAFTFYSQTNLGFSEVLDKSFSVSIGFFGGAATLTAAYIATLLFNDWRDPANHTTTKEQVLEAVGVLSQVKFKLNTMQDNLHTLNKINEFLIFNEELLVYDKEDLQKRFFEIVKNIRFIDETMFDEFARINHHYIYCEIFYILIINEYKKYFDSIVENQATLRRKIEIFPPKAYSYYGLDQSETIARSSLKRVLDRPVGFSTKDKNSCEEVFSFNDLSKMITETIEKIDKFERGLISKLKAT
ncbi:MULTISPECIES: hypothetical protein [unclassified Acinetobacter]|uniref:hypothetical protein n=1 Tax=unclassified Acinetobacter TaxID=196816 RepID=UPI0015D20F3F|nr:MULTISPECIES: hypothetical protein [unclassified Acinetobacter]